MNAVNHIFANWKTSLQGVLVAVVAIGSYLKNNPSAGIVPNNAIQSIVWVAGLAALILGLIQHDAKPASTSSVTIETTIPTPK